MRAQGAKAWRVAGGLGENYSPGASTEAQLPGCKNRPRGTGEKGLESQRQEGIILAKTRIVEVVV